MNKIKTALISVSDKTGLIELAQKLNKLDIKILSTGGSAKALQDSNIPVTEVSEHTKFPEMLDGRVKTLNPIIHGGILAKRNNDKHLKTIQKNGIELIDLVIINLYPFVKTIENPNSTFEDAIENIDIGGPAMIRSSAKNHADVAIITEPKDYDFIIKELEDNDGKLSLDTKKQLAIKAFKHTSEYDNAIYNYLSNNKEEIFPKSLHLKFEKDIEMRYGENPHQKAAFYKHKTDYEGALSNFNQLQGKELSFNNLNDAETAWECVKNLNENSCVIVKHANPCGVASDRTIMESYLKAFKTDPTSAFGGIIAFNNLVDEQTAMEINNQFAELIIAPEFSKKALEVFSAKRNLRLLQIPNVKGHDPFDIKKIGGGILLQTPDHINFDINDCKIVSNLKPTPDQLTDMSFAWHVAKYVKSNAIIFCKDKMTLGVGAGQMSRVDSTRIAAIKAENASRNLSSSVVASDAFFPFRDGIDVLAQYGAKCVIQPGGSMRDDEVIQAANEHNLVMLFTNIRHFKH
jgi:phosphoribosylaminoimidazolecarboxamide formyltransferase/IMP cyclohydrolase